jgi:multidrug efflux pump subunit AcrB
VVVDPITNVDNIQQHVFARKRNPRDATLFAVGEVLPPVILSTLAIIVSFTPMFFITGIVSVADPVFFTATALGAWPITLDPIFSGLAWALIFGLIASTLFTLVVVPVTFYAVYRHKYE